MARTGGVTRCGRAHGLKVDFGEWEVARSCWGARGDRADLLKVGVVFWEVARSCHYGMGRPCRLSVWVRVGICGGGV